MSAIHSGLDKYCLNSLGMRVVSAAVGMLTAFPINSPINAGVYSSLSIERYVRQFLQLFLGDAMVSFELIEDSLAHHRCKVCRGTGCTSYAA
jgi:hypothetical protein